MSWLMDPLVELSVRLYRALLILYPSKHRQEYGPLMVSLFREMCEEAAASDQLFPLFRLWRRTVVDLIVSALVEHLGGDRRYGMTWRFWFLWILAGVIGWMAAGVLSYPLLSFLTIVVGGALVSLLHTLLLQQFVAPPGWWRYGLILQAGSWLFPLLLLPAVAWSPAALLFSRDQLPGLTAVIIACILLVVSMALVGGGQGFALRPLLQHPWRWTAVPGIALLTSSLVVVTLNYTLLPLIANLVHSGTFSLALPSAGFIPPTVVHKLGMVWTLLQLLIAILASGTYGLTTGVALAVLLMDDGTKSTFALA